MPAPRPVEIGERVGRLVAVARRAPGETHVHARCDCGGQARVPIGGWGKTLSCGCLRAQVLIARSTRHGMAYSSEYAIWAQMVQRCTNPRARRYPDYGGRGITVCARWLDFAEFIADMRPRPKGLTLDRIDNDSGYGPDNCRWASYTEQRHNQRRVARTHCGRGHEMTPENTGRRGRCRACMNAYAREWKHRDYWAKKVERDGEAHRAMPDVLTTCAVLDAMGETQS